MNTSYKTILRGNGVKPELQRKSNFFNINSRMIAQELCREGGVSPFLIQDLIMRTNLLNTCFDILSSIYLAFYRLNIVKMTCYTVGYGVGGRAVARFSEGSSNINDISPVDKFTFLDF